MYKNLDHLSSEEVEKFKERYYSKDKEKLSNIIKDYELDVRTGELVKLIPDLQLEEKCEHCGTPLKFRYKSRTYYYSADHKKGEPYCPKCGHLPEEKHCKCHIFNLPNKCSQAYYNENDPFCQAFFEIFLIFNFFVGRQAKKTIFYLTLSPDYGILVRR